MSTSERLAPVDLFFNKHELREDMIDDAQMGVRIILIRLHYLCTCTAYSRLWAHGAWELCIWSHPIHTSSFLFPSTLLEENLPKYILLLVKRVIVLHIVVVRLIKHAV